MLAALLDVGVPFDYLQTELSRLKIDDEFRINVRTKTKMGISGTQVRVSIQDVNAAKMSAHHGDRGHTHHHPHRTFSEIKSIISSSDYTDIVKQNVLKMFRLIAEAESKIHNQDINAVHFHEVGATDSIVDIFGVAIGLDYLGIGSIVCGKVELGSGQVQCEHGLLPVPAPATLEILRGVNCSIGGVVGEATTPTGASILKSLVTDFKHHTNFTPTRIGYGIGHRDFSIPNVLRISLGSISSADDDNYGRTTDNCEIETNIDDMSAECFEPLFAKLFENGAKDVFATPIVMKKGRPAYKITVLCKSADAEELSDVLMSESTSIGVRIKPVRKRMLPRTYETVQTSYGSVGIKIVSLTNDETRWKLEHDDVLNLSKKQNVSYLKMKRILEVEVTNYLDQNR